MSSDQRSGALPALDQNHSLGCYVDRVPVTKRFGKPRQALPSLVTQGGAFSARGRGMLTLPDGFKPGAATIDRNGRFSTPLRYFPLDGSGSIRPDDKYY